jgi:Secreted repeat of unknown function
MYVTGESPLGHIVIMVRSAETSMGNHSLRVGNESLRRSGAWGFKSGPDHGSVTEPVTGARRWPTGQPRPGQPESDPSSSSGDPARAVGGPATGGWTGAGLGGGRVVTYDGWPLYTYLGDASPGHAAGQGNDDGGGYWYAMRPSGQIVSP